MRHVSAFRQFDRRRRATLTKRQNTSRDPWTPADGVDHRITAIEGNRRGRVNPTVGGARPGLTSTQQRPPQRSRRALSSVEAHPASDIAP